jgi:hypothetical protein
MSFSDSCIHESSSDDEAGLALDIFRRGDDTDRSSQESISAQSRETQKRNEGIGAKHSAKPSRQRVAGTRTAIKRFCLLLSSCKEKKSVYGKIDGELEIHESEQPTVLTASQARSHMSTVHGKAETARKAPSKTP